MFCQIRGLAREVLFLVQGVAAKTFSREKVFLKSGKLIDRKKLFLIPGRSRKSFFGRVPLFLRSRAGKLIPRGAEKFFRRAKRARKIHFPASKCSKTAGKLTFELQNGVPKATWTTHGNSQKSLGRVDSPGTQKGFFLLWGQVDKRKSFRKGSLDFRDFD